MGILSQWRVRCGLTDRGDPGFDGTAVSGRKSQQRNGTKPAKKESLITAIARRVGRAAGKIATATQGLAAKAGVTIKDLEGTGTASTLTITTVSCAGENFQASPCAEGTANFELSRTDANR